jgi:hypothetical protein
VLGGSSSHEPISTSEAGILKFVFIQSPEEPPVAKPRDSLAGPIVNSIGKFTSLISS